MYCSRCGGLMVDASKWTVRNLLERSGKHHHDITCWLPVFVAPFICNRDGVEFHQVYSVACQSITALRALYNEVEGKHA